MRGSASTPGTEAPGEAIREEEGPAPSPAPAPPGRRAGRWARFPFPPARFPIYYGWLIAVVGTLGMIATVPATPPGFAPFVDPILADLALPRTGLTLAFTWGTVAAGLVMPLAGYLVDWMGVRLAGAVAFGGLSLSMLAFGSADHLAGWLAGTGLSPEWSGGLLFFLLFFALRFWGLGFTMTTCRSMIFRWFVGWRSLVAGVNGVILSLSFSSSPALLNQFVIAFGWRGTWILLGTAVGSVFVLVALLFFRDSPESCGIPVPRGPSEAEGGPPEGPVFTARQAMATAAFWLMAAGLGMNAFIGTGTAFHIVSVGEDLGGLPRNEALQMLLYVGLFNVVTSLVLGFTAERIRLRYLLSFMMAAQTLSLAGLLLFRTDLGFWAYAVGSGCAWGTFGILLNVPWPRFYGRKHLGSINGIVTGVVVVCSALGPLAFGYSDALTGSYRVAIAGCLGLTPLLSLLGLKARNPRRTTA